MQDTNRLRVAHHARQLAGAVYRMTAEFPDHERFGLTAQMRRAAVSIGSNIAEGCGRRTNRELLPYLYNAGGSASELLFQLDLAEDFGFGTDSERQSVRDQTLTMQRMLGRLAGFLRSQPEWRGTASGAAPTRRPAR
jgi:four helix bundle protein